MKDFFKALSSGLPIIRLVHLFQAKSSCFVSLNLNSFISIPVSERLSLEASVFGHLQIGVNFPRTRFVAFSLCFGCSER